MDQLYKRPDREIDLFDLNPEVSYTIPAERYFCPDELEAEKKAIFQKSWMIVGHASELAEPGQYVTAEIAGQHVFVARGKDGELRGFFNVCQHRGHLLVSGKGKLKNLITCPYHAWAYDTSGALRAAPHSDTVKSFCKTDFALPQVAVDTLCGFVFVNLDPKARPIADVYAGVEELMRHHCPGIDELRPAREIVFDIAGNWKNVGDNLLECYHCAPAHKAFVDLVDMSTYQVETHENWSVQYGTCRASNCAYGFDDGGQPQTNVTAYLFPALAFGIFPGTGGVFSFTFLPTAPELTHQVFAYYSPNDELSDTETAALDYFQNVLGPEDVNLVETVQKGLHSLGYNQGRFIIDAERGHTSEHAVHHFHALIVRAMGYA